MSDHELYRLFLSGDQSAGDKLMIRYADALTAYLDGFLHNIHDAEDLMLECFTVILVNRPSIKEGGFRAYLFKVARNKAARFWRLKLSRPEFCPEDETGELPSEEISPEESAWKSEMSDVLARCLNRVAPQYREALWLFYYMGMDYAQASQVLGCSRKRIDNLLTTGRARLRAELEKEGITHDDVL